MTINTNNLGLRALLWLDPVRPPARRLTREQRVSAWSRRGRVAPDLRLIAAQGTLKRATADKRKQRVRGWLRVPAPITVVVDATPAPTPTRTRIRTPTPTLTRESAPPKTPKPAPSSTPKRTRTRTRTLDELDIPALFQRYSDATNGDSPTLVRGFSKADIIAQIRRVEAA